MSFVQYPATESTTLADGVQLDSFSRLRVSQATTIFDSQQEYGLDTLRMWDANANGTAATKGVNGSANDGAGNFVGARDSNTRMTPIRTSATSGHYAILQSRAYHRYIPGKSHLVFISGVFSPGTIANKDVRTGYFDAYNGVFLKVTNGIASFVRRTSTSGSVDDSAAVLQSAWNIDKFNGTGPSGITIDLTKTNILFIQAQWLGVGRVIVGFDVNGQVYPAHQFLHANLLTAPYTQTFNLPVRMEMRNTGATSAAGEVEFVCCSVQSEGGLEARGFPMSTPTSAASVGVTTRRPVLSIRPKATFNGVTNRAQIRELEALLLARTNDAFVEIVIGGVLTGAAWTSVDTVSIAEYDTTASAITGGSSVVKSFAVSGTGSAAQSVGAGIDLRNPFVLSQIDALTASQDSISIVVTSVSGTSNVTPVMNWHELTV